MAVSLSETDAGNSATVAGDQSDSSEIDLSPKSWYLAFVDPLLDDGPVYWELNKPSFTVGFFEGNRDQTFRSSQTYFSTESTDVYWI